MGIDWETRFAEYLNSCSDRVFRYGEYDCLIFTNEGIQALTGFGFASALIGRYAVDGRLRSVSYLRETVGCFSIPAYIDRHFSRTDELARGSVVAMRQKRAPFFALGIVWNGDIVGPGERGVIVSDTDKVAIAWRTNVA